MKAYSVAGLQYCAAGVGSGDNFGSYPATWNARQVLASNFVEILKTPSEGQTPIEGVHWKRTIFNPAVVMLHPHNVRCVPIDVIGDYDTTHMTLLDTEATLEVADGVPVECADVSDILTPPTPPPDAPAPWVSRARLPKQVVLHYNLRRRNSW